MAVLLSSLPLPRPTLFNINLNRAFNSKAYFLVSFPSFNTSLSPFLPFLFDMHSPLLPCQDADTPGALRPWMRTGTESSQGMSLVFQWYENTAHLNANKPVTKLLSLREKCSVLLSIFPESLWGFFYSLPCCFCGRTVCICLLCDKVTHSKCCWQERNEN